MEVIGFQNMKKEGGNSTPINESWQRCSTSSHTFLHRTGVHLPLSPLHEDKLKLRMGTKFQRFPRALCTDEGGRSLDADSLSVFLIFPS